MDGRTVIRSPLVRLALVTIACVTSATPVAQTQQQFTITTLFDVPGLANSYPLEINDNDEVVGIARFAADDREWGWRQDGGTIVFAQRLVAFAGHAAPTLSGYMLAPYFVGDSAPFQRTRVVTGGLAQPITNPALGDSEAGVYGKDINEGGLAVGFVIDLDGPSAGPFAFRWLNGTTALLDRDGVQASWAGAVNDLGMIAGGVRRAGDANLKPVIWWNGTRIALSPLDGVAHHVNNAGMVLGQFQSGVDRAFLWENGVLADPCPSLPQCTGMHLNEAGQALVRAGARSYIFDDGVLTDIGVLGPGLGTFAHTQIDNGAVVGYSSPDGSYVDARAFVYFNGTLRDLNDLLPPGSGWTRLIDAIGVNSRGRIVGIGIRGGIPKAFLMSPGQLPIH